MEFSWGGSTSGCAQQTSRANFNNWNGILWLAPSSSYCSTFLGQPESVVNNHGLRKFLPAAFGHLSISMSPGGGRTCSLVRCLGRATFTLRHLKGFMVKLGQKTEAATSPFLSSLGEPCLEAATREMSGWRDGRGEDAELGDIFDNIVCSGLSISRMCEEDP